MSGFDAIFKEILRSAHNMTAREGFMRGLKRLRKSFRRNRRQTFIRGSGAKARIDSLGFMRWLKPPPPSEPSFPAACKTAASFRIEFFGNL